MKFRKFQFLFFLLLAFFANLPLYCTEIKIMFFNLCNYFVAGDELEPIKPDFSKEAIAKIVKYADPDIFIAAEIGREKSYADFTALLEKQQLGFQYRRIIEGFDTTRHIVVFSKIKPKEFFERNEQTYKIRVKKENIFHELRAMRGFPHAIFEFEGGYRLHIIGAHLKSKLFHPLYNQTDMRRYEARLLRYLVDEILEKEPNANILVMGDMNDTFNSNPIRTLRAEDKKHELRLYDLRPCDQWQIYWTHWWNEFDSYGRIDYALASFSLLPEIIPEKTKIIHIPELWMFASDHRPILVTIKTEDQSEFSREDINKKYPELIGIPEPEEETESETKRTTEILIE